MVADAWCRLNHATPLRHDQLQLFRLPFRYGGLGFLSLASYASAAFFAATLEAAAHAKLQSVSAAGFVLP
eukprot:12136223-Karenia_brevis.AAC.1